MPFSSLFSSVIGLVMPLGEHHFDRTEDHSLRVKCRGTITAEFWSNDQEPPDNLNGLKGLKGLGGLKGGLGGLEAGRWKQRVDDTTGQREVVSVLEVKEANWPGEITFRDLLGIFV